MIAAQSRSVAGAAAVVAVYLAVVAALAVASMSRTGGRLVYPLDDTYVHMAIAKHTAVDGVWGVTSERFTSASSSPLWSALLAVVYMLTGVSDASPLVLNVAAGVALVASAYLLFVEAGMPALAAVPWSLIVVFAGTVPTLTMIGMEHTLHALLTTWFVVLAARRAAGNAASSAITTLLTLAGLVTLTRYEGVFAVACVTVAFAWMRRWREAAAVAAAGALPILAFGLWSVSQGGFLLPNSVLLKGVMPSMTAIGVAQLMLFWPALVSLAVVPHLAALLVMVLALAMLPAADRRGHEHRILAFVFAGCVLLHMQFARAGWFFRYEAYLMVAGLVLAGLLVQGVAWPRLIPARRQTFAVATGLVVVALLALPIARRARNALRQLPGAASNIFEQQYQAGLFLDEFYRGRRVAVNDVGAIGYLADVRLLDVYGLASADTAVLKRRGAYTTRAIDQLASREAVDIAIIYPTWLQEYGGVPAGWQKVGEWRVADNLVLGENGMSFFAVNSAARDTLTRNLAVYADRLPATVLQEGAYRAER